jgi:prepilin-type processing-associated H-X9-DG protein
MPNRFLACHTGPSGVSKGLDDVPFVENAHACGQGADREVYSFHHGGANAVFADGSVQFLQATLDIRIFARLATRAGGEVATVP